MLVSWIAARRASIELQGLLPDPHLSLLKFPRESNQAAPDGELRVLYLEDALGSL